MRNKDGRSYISLHAIFFTLYKNHSNFHKTSFFLQTHNINVLRQSHVIFVHYITSRHSITNRKALFFAVRKKSYSHFLCRLAEISSTSHTFWISLMWFLHRLPLSEVRFKTQKTQHHFLRIHKFDLLQLNRDIDASITLYWTFFLNPYFRVSSLSDPCSVFITELLSYDTCFTSPAHSSVTRLLFHALLHLVLRQRPD